MTLLASRLNAARYNSAFSDIVTQFPIDGALLPAEQAGLTSFQQKLAHAIADHEGTDVVTEITGNAVVPVIVASVTAVATGGANSGPGTGTGTIT